MKQAVDNSLAPSVAAASVTDGAALHTFETSHGLFSRLWRWIRSFQVGRSDERRLKVADTVSLGEKRFVAVVQVDGRHFLLAGGPANIALLAQLNEQDDFGDVLQKTMTVPPPAPVVETKVVEEVRAPRKRASRPRRKPEQAPIAPPRRSKPAAASQKVASAGTKKQPPLAAKRNSKPAEPQARFGNIPATQNGARAFERWLGRSITGAEARTHAKVARTTEPVVENPEMPGPLPTAVKAALTERLTEMRPAPEKPATPAVPEPAIQPSVEEYA